MKTDSAQIQYDKMTKTPINKLVLQLGLPTTVSMLVTSVYNMADTFFVSQLGTSVSGATRSRFRFNGYYQCLWVHVRTWGGQQYQPQTGST